MYLTKTLFILAIFGNLFAQELLTVETTTTEIIAAGEEIAFMQPRWCRVYRSVHGQI